MSYTHYDNLRITRNASPAIIKAAYRVLSAEYHPDKNLDRDTTRIMQILNDAYAVLSDPISRKGYDAKLAIEEAAAFNNRQTQDAGFGHQADRETEYQRQAAEAARQQQAKQKTEQDARAAQMPSLPPVKFVHLSAGFVAILFVMGAIALILS